MKNLSFKTVRHQCMLRELMLIAFVLLSHGCANSGVDLDKSHPVYVAFDGFFTAISNGDFNEAYAMSSMRIRNSRDLNFFKFSWKAGIEQYKPVHGLVAYFDFDNENIVTVFPVVAIRNGSKVMHAGMRFVFENGAWFYDGVASYS